MKSQHRRQNSLNFNNVGHANLTGEGMFKIEDVKFKVAIGCAGGGCILEVLVAGINTKTDVNEYGAYLDDFFHEGSPAPKKAGVYIFTGAAHGLPSSDEMHRYVGEFVRIETS